MDCELSVVTVVTNTGSKCASSSLTSSASTHVTAVANHSTTTCGTAAAAAAATAAAGGAYESVELLHVDWVQELPEDLDVCIAQRDFEAAVDLIQKSIFARRMSALTFTHRQLVNYSHVYYTDI